MWNTEDRSSPAVQRQWSSAGRDFVSFFDVLPASLLEHVIVLSLQDQEVLAYMIGYPSKTPVAAPHAYPHFHCDCFGCYTVYWKRWNSLSPSRVVIDEAIEVFEDYVYVATKEEDSITIPPSPAMPEKDGEEDDLVMIELSEDLRAEHAAAMAIAIARSGGERRPGLIRKYCRAWWGLLRRNPTA